MKGNKSLALMVFLGILFFPIGVIFALAKRYN